MALWGKRQADVEAVIDLIVVPAILILAIRAWVNRSRPA